MKFLSIAFASTCLFVATNVSQTDASTKRRRLRGSEEDNTEQDLQGRYIIRYKKDHKIETKAALAVADENQKKKGKSPMYINHEFDRLGAMAITATNDEISELRNITNILSIELDAPRYLLSPVSSKSIRNQVRTLQNDSEDLPYGINMVKAPNLWDQGYTGKGAKVCVIDSGFDYEHPDFTTSNIDGTDAELVWDEDGCGHGTHVTGTISAKDDGKGVAGVAPDVEIFTVRVFDDSCELAHTSDLVRAVYLCRDNGVHIISMSLGGGVSMHFEEEVFESLYFEDNILSVAAAGNDGTPDYTYPASYPSVMSVAAIDPDKEIASFSQYNDQVDIAAPGVQVESTLPIGGCELCYFNETDGYGSWDGTSMATPHVSAVAALLLSSNSSVSAVDLRNAIQNTAEDLGGEGWDDSYGYGLIQADAALAYLKNGGWNNNSTCEDTYGWHDSEGPHFDCGWYGQKDNCEHYGHKYENFNQTASEACCICKDTSHT